MSKLALALAILAASGSGATAACHHYSRWYYPKPQTCGASVPLRTRAATAHDWYVEITKLPPLPDLSKDTADEPALDEERKAAIDELKGKMK